MSDENAIAAQHTMMSLTDNPEQLQSQFSQMFTQAQNARYGTNDDIYEVEFRPF